MKNNSFFSLSQIYDDFHKTVDDADYRTDLEWWAKNYGADMPIDLPSFEVSKIDSKMY